MHQPFFGSNKNIQYNQRYDLATQKQWLDMGNIHYAMGTRADFLHGRLVEMFRNDSQGSC